MNSKTFIYKELEFNASLYEADNVELQRQLFQSKIKRARKQFAKKIIAFINAFDTSAKMTELLSAIVPIARIKAKNVKVFFFTDGIESSSYRDMTRNSFKSEREAIAAAGADVLKLRKKFQLPKTLTGIQQIRFVIPVNMEANSELLQFLEVYWKEVFRIGFGFDNVVFETI